MGFTLALELECSKTLNKRTKLGARKEATLRGQGDASATLPTEQMCRLVGYRKL